MRIVGTRKQHQLSRQPSGAALKALAAVPTTGMQRGAYRFATHAQANAHADAHADEALTRAIAENLIARKLVP